MPREFDARRLSMTKENQAQMTNWYEITIPGISEDVPLMVKNCTLPTLNLNPVELGFGNTKAKVAGQATYDDSTFTFRDAIIKDTELELLGLVKKAYDPETGKMGWVSDYKGIWQVTKYGPDGTYERPWTFEGAWISSISGGSLDHDNSGDLELSCTVTYDRAYRS